jgi:cation transport protein ChaC
VTLIDRPHYDTLIDHVCYVSDVPQDLSNTHEHFSAPDERVWGAAYHIPTQHVRDVKEYLDIREVNGYSIQYTPFIPAASSQDLTEEHIHCLVYIGMPDNPQFMGPQDPQKLAEHILRSKGPSGENREYLYQLETALLALSPESGDGHVSDLADRCRKLEEEGGWEIEKGAKLSGHYHGVGRTEEQEVDREV